MALDTPLGGSAAPPAHTVRQAITDVYDERRRAFLVQYPVALVVALCVSGVIVLGLTGFLGYSNTTDIADGVFRQPWLLYLWLCSLILTLEVSILRHPSLRRQRDVTLAVTIICIILVLITYYYSIPFQDLLNALLSALFNLQVQLVGLTASRWTYALLNFGALAIYAVDSAGRWTRRARGLSPNPRVDIYGPAQTTSAAAAEADAEWLPTLPQLISGDVLAGALLCVVLALLFRSDVIATIWNALHVHTAITGCTVAWPFGDCAPPGGGLHDPPTLTFIDVTLALVALPAGLIVLALAAVISGLNALVGVQGDSAANAPVTQGESSTQAVSQNVLQTVLDTIRSAFTRRSASGAVIEATPAEVATESLLLPLRNVIWPPLIFIGVLAAAQSASAAQAYMHSDKGFVTEILNAAPALLWEAGSLVAIMLAVGVLIFHGRIVENTSRFLGLIAFVLLLTFWLFSLALWGFNKLLLITNATNRHPFDPPAWNTAISLLALLIFGITFLVRRTGRPRALQPATISATPAGDAPANAMSPSR